MPADPQPPLEPYGRYLPTNLKRNDNKNGGVLFICALFLSLFRIHICFNADPDADLDPTIFLNADPDTDPDTDPDPGSRIPEPRVN
jgi:hypothetical protein